MVGGASSFVGMRGDESREMISHQEKYPDFGPINIDDIATFLVNAKTYFNEQWQKQFTHTETLEDFVQLQLLGSGSFGNVVLLKNKSTKQYYAMKVIEKEKILKMQQLKQTRNEKLVLQSVNSPFTVYLCFFFQDNSNVYMVMPFIPGGALFTHLQICERFDEIQARFFASQVVLALEYLHYLGLIYRDVKPENILIDHTGYLKLADFGFCKRINRKRTYTVCGTPEFLSPEQLVGTKGYGMASDWWAVGVLLYEMVAGQTPFYARDRLKMYKKIVNTKYRMPEWFTADLQHLLRNLLQADLTKRYGNLKNGIADIKDHKWFRQTNWLATLNRKVSAIYQPKYTHPGDTTNFESLPWTQPNIASENKYSHEFDDF